MASSGSIGVVLFDADGVIQRTAPAWHGLLSGLCPDPERVESFLADVFAAERPCLTGADDFRDALERVLRRWRCTAGVDEVLHVWTLIEPDEGALHLVRRLRSGGIRAALATNQQHHRAAHMIERLDYAASFDELFFSCELGYAKPSAGYFHTVLDRLGADPTEVLFIDDHADNVTAAQGVGIRAAQFHLDQGAAALERLLVSHGLTLADGQAAPG